MVRSRHKLSTLALKKLSATPGRHSDGGNLYLSVSKEGSRRWVFLYRWQGRTVEMGLGRLDDVGLADARAKAQRAREQLANGESPLANRLIEGARPTFGKAADDLIVSLKPGWKNAKHAAQWEMTLQVYAAPLRPLPVDKIQTEDVLNVLQPIWTKLPETATRVRGRIERVLDAAKAKGHRSGENPARWKGHLDHLLPKAGKLTRGHHPAMPYQEVPDFWPELRANLTVSNLALAFTILTAARSGETRLATWDEIDPVLAIWTVPAERMKEEREHRVPLTGEVLNILDQVKRITGKRQSRFIFPGLKRNKPLSDMSLSAVLRRAGKGEFTVHGFRSSFRDWAGDETTFPREVAEAALSHAVGDESERAYRRGDALNKRRELMRQWLAFLNRNLNQNEKNKNDLSCGSLANHSKLLNTKAERIR